MQVKRTFKDTLEYELITLEEATELIQRQYDITDEQVKDVLKFSIETNYSIYEAV